MKILALRGKHYRVPPLERKAAPFQFLVMNQAPTKESDLCPFGTQVDCVPLPFTSDAIFYCRVCGNTWPQFRTPGRQTWTPRNPNDKLRAMSYAGMRIMKIAEDVPRHAGDLCPIDYRPVRRKQMSACGEHYALYCDVCQTFWPDPDDVLADATRKTEELNPAKAR